MTQALGEAAKREHGEPAQSSKPAPIVPEKRRGKPAKRMPEDVAKMGEVVVAYVAKHPGQSVEQIKKALGIATKELRLPIVHMVAAKKLKTTGERRGTRDIAGSFIFPNLGSAGIPRPARIAEFGKIPARRS